METLESILAQHQIALAAEQVAALKRYCQVLWDLNTQFNLTRHVDYEAFVTRDLVDALQLCALLREGETVLDIGSGGGAPGLLIAILRPDLAVTLSDSVSKKARALEQLAAAAGVHVEVYKARAESLLDDFRFDSATARAVGPLDRLLSWMQGRWDVLGRLLAVKGPKWSEERAAAEKQRLLEGLRCTVASEYTVPGAGWTSTILEVRPIQ